MKVIPETRRAHYIWYLRFFYWLYLKLYSGFTTPSCL